MTNDDDIKLDNNELIDILNNEGLFLEDIIPRLVEDTPWRPKLQNQQVSWNEIPTEIDHVLEFQSSEYKNFKAQAIIQCKWVDALNKSWYLCKIDPTDLELSSLKIDEDIQEVPVPLIPITRKERKIAISNKGFEINHKEQTISKPLRKEDGHKYIKSNPINDACYQSILSTLGHIIDLVNNPDFYYGYYIIPVIITTAKLFVIDIDTNEIDKSTGMLNHCSDDKDTLSITPVPRLIYNYIAPTPLHYKSDKNASNSTIRNYQICIVNSSYITEFFNLLRPMA
jgi:hypothetical protein